MALKCRLTDDELLIIASGDLTEEEKVNIAFVSGFKEACNCFAAILRENRLEGTGLDKEYLEAEYISEAAYEHLCECMDMDFLNVVYDKFESVKDDSSRN